METIAQAMKREVDAILADIGHLEERLSTDDLSIAQRNGVRVALIEPRRNAVSYLNAAINAVDGIPPLLLISQAKPDQP